VREVRGAWALAGRGARERRSSREGVGQV